MEKLENNRCWDLVVQVVITHNDGIKGPELERELFLLRKLMENEKARRISADPVSVPTSGPSAADFYICTLSNKTIVYKASHTLTALTIPWLWGLRLWVS